MVPCSAAQKLHYLFFVGSIGCEYIEKQNFYCMPGEIKLYIYIAYKEMGAATADPW